MGLFGILFTGFALGTKVVQQVNKDAECIEARKNKQNSLTFQDSLGKTRLRETGQLVTYGYSGKDYVLYDSLTMNILYNFSEQTRQNKIQQNKIDAIKKGESTYCCDEKDYHVFNYLPHGKRYCDIKTGNIFVIRECYENHGIYYYDINSKKIIRPTDWQENMWNEWQKKLPLEYLNNIKELEPYRNNQWNKLNDDWK